MLLDCVKALTQLTTYTELNFTEVTFSHDSHIKPVTRANLKQISMYSFSKLCISLHSCEVSVKVFFISHTYSWSIHLTTLGLIMLQ